MPAQVLSKTSYAFLRQKASLASTSWLRRRRLQPRAFLDQDSGYHPKTLQTDQKTDQRPNEQHDRGHDRRRHRLPKMPPTRIVPPHHRAILPHNLIDPPLDRGIMFLMFGRTRQKPAKTAIRLPAPLPTRMPQFPRLPNEGSPACHNGQANHPRNATASH